MSIKKVGEYRFVHSRREFKALKKKVIADIAEDSKNHFLMGFREGGGRTDNSSGGWKKRKYQDYTKAGKPMKRSRAILVGKGSGNLRDSIRVSSVTSSKAIISSDLPYSDIHNTGGTITQTVTAKQRAFFYGMYKKTKDSRFKSYAAARTLTIKIPQREFIGNSKVLEGRIERNLTRRFVKFL